MRIEKEIQLINEIVCQAAIQDGRINDTYWCNNTGGMVKALKKWIKGKGKEDLYKVGIVEYKDESNRVSIFNVPLIVNINDSIPEYEPKPVDF